MTRSVVNARIGKVSMTLMMNLLIFVCMMALSRIIIPEAYVIAITCLAIIASIAAIKRNSFAFLSSVLVTYIVICLSWALASHFKTLPRDDIYHYYPFTRFVNESGHFTYPGMERELEQIFLGIIVPWPAWHILLATLSHVINLDLFYTVQVAQSLTTAPLVLLTSFIIGKLLSLRERDTVESVAPYLLAIMMPFLSFYVYSNTNPVSRSFASAIYPLIIYVVFRIVIDQDKRWLVILLTLLLCLVYSHPYWCLSGPLTISLALVIALIIAMLIGRQSEMSKASVCKVVLLPCLVAISASISWVVYYAYTAKISLANAIRTLMTMKWKDILGENVAKPWLQTRTLQHEFFKVHPLEPMIYWMVWITDLIPIAIAVLGLALALQMALRRKLSVQWMLTLAFVASAALIALATGAASSGLITRYATKLVYVSLTILAALSMQELQRRNHMYKTMLNAALAFMVVIFVVTAALSLGTRTYQASFIWSHNISFEDKGMHSTHGEAVMNFCNKYCNYNVFSDVLTDDSITRVFLDAKTFVELSKNVGVMPPHSFTILSHLKTIRHNVLVISVRNFKPTYWVLRSWTWYHINVWKRIEISKDIILSEGSRLYDNGYSQVYYLQ